MNSEVRSQYERYPYPFRDPDSEVRGKTKTVANSLPLMGHYLFRGNSLRFKKFRALVAGGGTGDATVHLAEQLAAVRSEGEIVHLDISTQSIDIARRRVEKLRLHNVRFVEGSLLDLAEMGIENFDYIDCTGVLHHLDDPLAGVKALGSVLKEDGGISIMLYGELGRTGVYHFQEMIRMLGEPDDTLEDLVHLSRHLLSTLPKSNWLVRSGWIQAVETVDDSEIVDLFLHVRDRAYRVDAIYDLVETAGLRIVTFLPPFMHNPTFWIPPGDKLHKRLSDLSYRDRAQFAELLTGGPNRHLFFAVPTGRENTVATNAGTEEVIPVLLDPAVKPQIPGQAGAFKVAGTSVAITELECWLMYYIDNNRSLSEIYEKIRENSRHSEEAVLRQTWARLYGLLNSAGMLVLQTRGDKN